MLVPKPWAVIFYFDFQTVVPATGMDLNPSRCRTALDAMADGVLHTRLQSHLRHRSIENAWLGEDFRPQAIGESHLLDRQIQFEVFQLATERDLLLVDVFEYAAQKIAQPRQHLLRLFALLLANQHHDGIQGVEQKMRLQLHFERAQLRVGQLAFQLCGVEFQAQSLLFAFLIFPVVVQAVLAAQQQEIGHDSLMKSNGEQENECRQQSRHEGGKDVQVVEDDAFDEQLSERDGDADGQMH